MKLSVNISEECLFFESKTGESIKIYFNQNLYYIDLFCGAGGVSSGIVRAGAQVILCINHDPIAIESHKSNIHNSLHAEEKIENFDLTEIEFLVNEIRKYNPNAIICLWASLECTHFSKAKGGDHREADSRTLAEHLYRYIEVIKPDYIDIENVIEFMSWGPLRIACEKTHENRSDLKIRKRRDSSFSYHFIPYSKKNGKYYMKWWNKICEDYGYEYDFRILNSADFGALTARTRYFGQFKKNHLPFTWPKPTHAKNPEKEGMFGGLKPWRAVKVALDLKDKGKSIFGRKKPLSENTLKRIYAGLVKYVGDGKEPEFITKYFSGRPEGKVKDLNQPLGAITCFGGGAIVQPEFLMKYHGNGDNVLPLNGPASTITTKDRIALINVVWLDKQFRSDANHQSIERPAGTILTNDKHCKITAERDCFIMNQFTGGGNHSSVDKPLGAITTVPKSNLIHTEGWLFNHNYHNKGSDLEKPCPTLLASRKHYYILNPQYSSKGNDIERPCFTLIARMDKMPPYLVESEEGQGYIIIYDDDCDTSKKIKLFMAMHGIVDVKMRMLKVKELLRIQGFGEQYVLKGNQTDQKRFIGNAVEVNLAKCKVKARIEILSKVREEVYA